MSVLGISLKDNKEQQELFRLMQTKDIPIILCTGNAGTGKTFTALLSALQMQEDKRYKHIVYGRNPMPLGYDMGALPGGLEEKYDPYMGPLYDNLEAITHVSDWNLNPSHLLEKIEVMPIAFLRGRSFQDTVLIIDEAQNLDLTCLKAILTRISD